MKIKLLIPNVIPMISMRLVTAPNTFVRHAKTIMKWMFLSLRSELKITAPKKRQK